MRDPQGGHRQSSPIPSRAGGFLEGDKRTLGQLFWDTCLGGHHQRCAAPRGAVLSVTEPSLVLQAQHERSSRTMILCRATPAWHSTGWEGTRASVLSPPNQAHHSQSVPSPATTSLTQPGAVQEGQGC